MTFTQELNDLYAKVGLKLKSFFDQLQMIHEVSSYYEDVSLFHKVIRIEVEGIQNIQLLLDQEMTRMDDQIQQFIENFDSIKYFGEDFNKEQFTNVMQDMEALFVELINI